MGEHRMMKALVQFEMTLLQICLVVIAGITTAAAFKVWTEYKAIRDALCKQTDLIHSLNETNLRYQATVKEKAKIANATPSESEFPKERTNIEETTDPVDKKQVKTQKENKAIESSMESVIAKRNSSFSLDILAISAECE